MSLNNGNPEENPDWFDSLSSDTPEVIHPASAEQWVKTEWVLFIVTAFSVYGLWILFPAQFLLITFAALVSLFATVKVLASAQTKLPAGREKTNLYVISTAHMFGLAFAVFWCLSSMVAYYLNTL